MLDLLSKGGSLMFHLFHKWERISREEWLGDGGHIPLGECRIFPNDAIINKDVKKCRVCGKEVTEYTSITLPKGDFKLQRIQEKSMKQFSVNTGEGIAHIEAESYSILGDENGHNQTLVFLNDQGDVVARFRYYVFVAVSDTMKNWSPE